MQIEPSEILSLCIEIVRDDMDVHADISFIQIVMSPGQVDDKTKKVHRVHYRTSPERSVLWRFRTGPTIVERPVSIQQHWPGQCTTPASANQLPR